MGPDGTLAEFGFIFPAADRLRIQPGSVRKDVDLILLWASKKMTHRSFLKRDKKMFKDVDSSFNLGLQLLM
jgi:hypothetical protein